MPLFLLLLALITDESWTLRRVEGRLALAPSGSVRIENPYGTVRTRPGNEGEAVFLANVQEQSEAAQARVRHETTPEGLRFWVELEGTQTPHPQVDLALRLPSGTALDVETADGLIEIKGQVGPLVARSTSGEIRILSAGTIEASSESGRIAVVLESLAAESRSKVETGTGEIVLWLPANPDLLVQAATRGDITTDYSIEIERVDGSRLKRAVARIGAATSEFTASSELAPIKILSSNP